MTNFTNFSQTIPPKFLLLLISIRSNIECTLIINKCCQKGMIFDKSLKCVDIPAEYSTEPFHWFPTNSIVDVTSLKVLKFRREFYLKLLEKAIVKFGEKPECDGSEIDSTSFSDEKPLFNFLLFNNSELRVHVSSNKTLHRYEDSYKFLVVEEEETEENSTENTENEVMLRTFPLESVCVDAVLNTNRYRILICPCKSSVCIRKCCKDDEYYNITAQNCEPLSEIPANVHKWRPKDFTNGVDDKYYLLSDTFPSCDNPLLLKVPDHAFKSCNRFNKDTDNDFTIYSNGSIKVNKYKKPFETHQYCGEVTWHENGKVYEQNLILCSAFKQNEQTKSRYIKSIIYGTILIIGGVCLLITVAVSLYLPELRRRMHNKIALSHNVSLMVAYFTWGVGQLSPDLGGRSCMLIALIIQFTFLGSFFWLNVMCIDISMTFSATRSLGGHSTMGDYKKFMYYCIYSWGSTALISVITVIMEFLPDIPYDFLKPGFACSCGFNTANASIIIYFYGPMSLLLIFNLILFIFTTIKIISVQRQTAILHKTESNTTGGTSYQTDKQRYDLIQWLILYAKLFLLMGLTWITEIISWAVGGPDYYWYFSDILNLLRAVFIFILFICKRPVLESLKRKIQRDSSREGCSKSLSDVNSTSTSVRDSRLRSSTSSNKRKESAKTDAEVQKLIMKQKPCEVLPRNGEIEESCI